MTVAVMAAALVFTVSADSDGTVYVSNNSLYRYTLDENKKATILSYSGTESNIIINRIGLTENMQSSESRRARSPATKISSPSSFTLR